MYNKNIPRKDIDMKEELQSLLYKTYDFYKPSTREKAIEKAGIGHEAEHVKGVLMRMNEAVNIFEACKNEKMRNDSKYDIDRAISSTVAAFHDIGNCIDRDTHNHLGRGIIQGELSYTDILSVPNPKLFKEDQEYLYKIFQENDVESINKALEDSKYATKIVTNIFIPKLVFEKGYNGLSNEEAINRLNYELKIPEEFNEIIYNTLKNINFENAEKLQEITADLHQLFTPDQLQTIAEAIQDHNIDYDHDHNRYQARSIYGSLIADADKDNVAITFALRTFAYAINKWTQKSDVFTNEGRPDYEICTSHIMHQAWERYRVDNKQAPPEGIHAYKTLDKINGVEEAIKNETVKRHIEEGHSLQDAIELTAYENDYGLYIVPDNANFDAGKQFFVLSDQGADNYSQIDKILSDNWGEKLTPIRDSKKEFTEIISIWAEKEYEQENIKRVSGLLRDMWEVENSTIEAMVNIPESIRWNDLEKDIDVNRIIKEIVDYSEQEPGTIDSKYNKNFSYEDIVDYTTIRIPDDEFYL